MGFPSSALAGKHYDKDSLIGRTKACTGLRNFRDDNISYWFRYLTHKTRKIIYNLFQITDSYCLYKTLAWQMV